jgi:ribose 5-phosphate isomerase A
MTNTLSNVSAEPTILPPMQEAMMPKLSVDEMKKEAAKSALTFILNSLPAGSVLGIGSGSTVSEFIRLLQPYLSHFKGVVSASQKSSEQLKEIGIPILELNEVECIPIYLDGADEINPWGQMIKGGGAALTREKIIASVADQFVVVADINKCVNTLGHFPLPIEIIPMAAQALIRRFALWGGKALIREGCVTDNQNWILDVHGLSFEDAVYWEREINQLPGVVTNGLFASRSADQVFVSDEIKIWSLMFDPVTGPKEI